MGDFWKIEQTNKQTYVRTCCKNRKKLLGNPLYQNQWIFDRKFSFSQNNGRENLSGVGYERWTFRKFVSFDWLKARIIIMKQMIKKMRIEKWNFTLINWK